MENNQTETVQINEEDKLAHAKKAKQKRLKKIVSSLLGVSIFFFLTTIYLSYEVYALKKLARAEELAHPEIPVTPNQILEAVARHMILPDTVPQVATVEDAKKLSATQDFFKDVINGDVVVVYETMIVVYRPSSDILIAVGNVSDTKK